MAVPQPAPAVDTPHPDDAPAVGTPRSAADWFAGFQRHILETADYEPLCKILPGMPDDYLDIQFAQQKHLQAQNYIWITLDETLRRLAINAIDDYQRHVLEVPPLPDGDSRNRLADRLAEKGHVTLPAISPETVSEILAYLSWQPVIDPKNQDELLTIDAARENLNVGHYQHRTMLACPHLVEIANDPLMLATVEKYLGATPTLLTPLAWWSFAGPELPRDAQLFHIDHDDYRFCKLFVYLTDVDADSGPHNLRGGNEPMVGYQRRPEPLSP